MVNGSKMISLASLLLLANGNPNKDLAGSLQKLPQAPVITVPKGTGYDHVYNQKAL